MRSTANCPVKRWRWLAGHIVSVGRSRISDFHERLTLFALELIGAVNKRVPRLRYATTRTFGDGRIVHRKGRTRNSLIIFFRLFFQNVVADRWLLDSFEILLFGSVKIGRTVRPWIHAAVSAISELCGRFAVDWFVLSSCSQKIFGRAFKELSIGVLIY